ncbi:hypothetical protein ACFT5B_18755 [Luteimicrobium sp. NPDC057192]|uniref:hypothetical protein n=1 Tax=Luteimicrobium sp. NPDC057192 TaxID=3346042 RepID=UPI003629E4E1
MQRVDWLTFEYRDGVAVRELALETDATFVSLGDIAEPELVATVEALPPDVAVLHAGPPVTTSEVFALSADRTVVTPLSHDAVALVGAAPVRFAEFRTAAEREWRVWVDAQPTDLPSDVVGAAGGVAARQPAAGGGGASSMSTGESLLAASIYVVIPGLLAFVLWERRHTLRAAAREKARAPR